MDENRPFEKLKDLKAGGEKHEKPEKDSDHGNPRQEDEFTRAMRDVHPLGDPRGMIKEAREKSSDLNRPFENLAAPEKDRSQPRETVEKSEQRFEVPPSLDSGEPEIEECEEDFMRAMQGVAPLDSSKGRQVAPKREKTAGVDDQSDPDADALRRLKGIVEGGIEFTLEFSDEFMHGQVKGLDSRVFQRLKAGRYSCEGNIDLHGMNSDQAWRALIGFIRDHYFRGSRCVLIVHGRGRNSPGGMGVLKRELQSWLTREPLRRVVLAFVTAQPEHGGAGAAYVLLRKFRKTGGKVKWDRLPPELEWPEH
jgi:DNA-nicking Smr family endonuclease